MSLQQRAIDMSAKMNAQFAAGDSAFLVWNWDLETLGPCSYNTGPTDSSLLPLVASQSDRRLTRASRLRTPLRSWGKEEGEGTEEQVQARLPRMGRGRLRLLVAHLTHFSGPFAATLTIPAS